MDSEAPLPSVTVEPDLQMHPVQRLQAVMELVRCGLQHLPLCCILLPLGAAPLHKLYRRCVLWEASLPTLPAVVSREAGAAPPSMMLH